MVDKSERSSIEIPYQVPFDDTAFDETDVRLEDSKTHQFFALAGNAFSIGTSYKIYPYDAADAEPLELPSWITWSDVMRTAEASAGVSGSMFSSADLPHDWVLEGQTALLGRWLRITYDDARLPIRITQAFIPVRWDLTHVEPGIYTIAGYVFSPPYNAWAIRPGVVKVKDAQSDVSAGVLSSIVDSVFSYQGRRVKLCLDVPEGTRMSGYYHVEDQPASGWMPWLDERPVETGELELCFHARGAPVSGSLRLRMDLIAPDGALTTLHSHDTLTWLQGRGTCEESDTQCCDFEHAADDQLADSTAPPSSPEQRGVAPEDPPRAAAEGCSLMRLPRSSCEAGFVLWAAAWLTWRRAGRLKRVRDGPCGRPSVCRPPSA